MTLLSPANNTYSDIEFILRGRSFKCIVSNRGARIDPCGTPCFIVPHAVELVEVTSTFCLLYHT